ncbi:DUF4167 domain-containing protein [Sphingomonas nostoxanthinifaciens]|uniref:DUF4167 domain-containing protein n=1 Tax=Sphingomonas nostoxanthinifaciens TaxID=2872652 RepID=UPI001CC1D9C5|nr:DUF4167 domain-containing protein [Sphingomonas nostoxanthinifaciens]
MNNRQNGRRRGRGGQQARNGQPGVPDRGSRLDNRARGNAAQLLEKYKTLARDAQMQGDRVNTEYYLQFADHYFRVLSENRSRFEEQQQQRRGREDFNEFGNEGDDADGQSEMGADDGWDDGFDARPPQQQAPQQRAQQPSLQNGQPRREQRPAYQPEAAADESRGQEQAPAAARGEMGDADGPRRDGRRGRRNNNGASANGAPANGSANGHDELALEPARIAIDLPPRLTAEPVAESEAAEAAPKRRRARKPKSEVEAETVDA